MKFFLPCSRVTSSEKEQKCLKKSYGYQRKSLWKKPTLKKTNNIHLLLLTHLLHLSTWKKIEKKKKRKNYNKYTWSHLLKTCLMNTKWWNEISFSRKKISWKNDFTKKNAKKISLMSKTMRKKKMKRYVQNLPYMHHDENSFRKSQISVTLSRISGYIQSKLLLYCYRYTTILLLQLHHNIITILWIVKKKVFFNHFVTVFLPPTKIIVDLNLWRMRNCKQAPHLQQYTQKILLLKNQKSI